MRTRSGVVQKRTSCRKGCTAGGCAAARMGIASVAGGAIGRAGIGGCAGIGIDVCLRVVMLLML